jgi:Cu(I)/Ag(I) efflux system membrane fusion protein
MTDQEPFVRRGSVRLIVIIVLVALAGVAAGFLSRDPLRRLAGSEDESTVNEASPEPKQLWTCGMHPQVIREEPGLCPICEMELTPVKTSGDSGSNGSGDEGDRTVEYWWDPMMTPPYISSEPGKSPKGMDLIPVYADEIMAGPAVTIDPVVVQNMGVRIAPVIEAPLRVSIRATGMLQEPEPNHLDINLRVSGWIEKLHANVDGMRIDEGDPLFDLYSPALQVAVDELIASRRAMPQSSGAPSMPSEILQSSQEAARRKLELAGVDEAQIERIAQMDHAPHTIRFSSPMTGHLTAKMVYEGAAVEAGQLVLRLADNSTMWIDVRVFEQDSPLMHTGQKVKATVAAMPGRVFEGEVIFIHPHLDEMTRTALVRIAIPNPGLQLRQGMYATVHIEAEVADRAMLVPREAIIDTGDRQVALVAVSGATFEPRRVTTGVAGDDGLIQVLSGLAPGEAVVTSGQFLLDSESRMKEAIQKYLSANLLHPPGASAAPATSAIETQPVPHIISGAWTPDVDVVFAEYLKIAHVLGEKQDAPTPVDAIPLLDASIRLAEQSNAEARELAESVSEAAATLDGKSIDEQREAFKIVSEAVIALAQRVPPSTAVADSLYIAHCPMAPGNWLQTQQEIANPYYATSMKRCGEIKGRITATSGGGGGGGEDRR